jgi:hypothetical protein
MNGFYIKELAPGDGRRAVDAICQFLTRVTAARQLMTEFTRARRRAPARHRTSFTAER